MLATVHAGSLLGIDAHGVSVEADFMNGLPGFDIIGLPEAAVRESRERVKAALMANGFALPKRRLLLNLAPGDLRKSGTGFDLAVAVAVLAACGACAPTALPGTLILGELSLSGEIRGIRGVLAQVRSASLRGLRTVIVPAANGAEARLAEDVDVRVARHLTEVVAHLNGQEELPRPEAVPPASSVAAADGDFADVAGQAAARRGLLVAAAGHHHVLLVGPPGAGKTMLARRLVGILPEATDRERLEMATIASIGDPARLADGRVRRPFRAPHHHASSAALVGGGDPIHPGEMTLAHGGVLFLDELPEFGRAAIEALRTTMELGEAHVARARQRVRMPAQSLVVAAMNPCPCGYAGSRRRVCLCGPDRIARYQGRISGPLLDRFDVHLFVPAVPPAALRGGRSGESSEELRARVTAARARVKWDRDRELRRGVRELLAGVPAAAVTLLDEAVVKLGLSARGYVKALRVARTIAAVDGEDHVTAAHVAEAIQYRLLDRGQESSNETHNPPQRKEA